ncbi:MAG: ferritin-like domain-containing protein [Methylophilaceae bacterium]|nr:ferritin-like domain-containing protein [Methylophilaceae bacterium]
MLSTKSIFREIRQNRDAFKLLLSIAAKGETQGGWENERIAALTRDPVAARKVLRHGADETKHGLMFAKLLHKARLDTVAVPMAADYCMLLEQRGIGLPHTRLKQEEPLDKEEFLKYLVHSKVTEERASEEVNLMLKVFQDDPDLAPTLGAIADDEINHVSYTHEELLKLCAQGEQDKINRLLKDYAMVEIRVYRQVGQVFVRNMAQMLGWSRPKQWLLEFGVFATYLIERAFTWRRLVALRPPVRPNAMG